LIHVSKRSAQRIQSLFETAVKSFASLFPEIAYVIGGNDRLNVGREATTSGVEIKTLVDEMNFDALIRDFADLGPVPSVSRA